MKESVTFDRLEVPGVGPRLPPTVAFLGFGMYIPKSMNISWAAGGNADVLSGILFPELSESLLIALLSGTAPGAFLSENLGPAAVMLLPVFLLSAIATWRLLE